MRSSKTALDGLFFWNPEAVGYSESSVNTYWWRYFSTIKLLSNMTFYSHVDPCTNQLRVVTQILESHNKKNKDCKNQKNLLSAVCSFGLVWTLPKNFTRLIDCCVFKKWRYFKPPFPQAVFSLFLFAQQRARKKSVTVHQKDERKWLEVSSTPNFLTQKYSVRLVDSLHRIQAIDGYHYVQVIRTMCYLAREQLRFVKMNNSNRSENQV